MYVASITYTLWGKMSIETVLYIGTGCDSIPYNIIQLPLRNRTSTWQHGFPWILGMGPESKAER
jgi:hypothetical protein